MERQRLSLTLVACCLALPAWAQNVAPQGVTPVQQGVPVTVAKPFHQDIPVYLRGLGLVSAYKTVTIRPRVDGTLERVAFTEGDEVKAGQLLAQIDPRPYQATLDQAIAKRAADDASLVNARLTLNRSSQLVRNQFESQQTMDTNTSAVAQLQASIKGDDASIAAAKLNVEFCHITAPFDGRLGLRLIDPGNYVRAADSTSPGLVILSEIRPISVTFPVAQDNLQEIIAAMANAKLAVFASSADDKTVLAKGQLLTIDNTIDTTTGTIKIKATFENSDSHLWPGQFINARLLLKTRPNVLTVPSAAVQRGPAGFYLFVVKPDQTVVARPVDVVQDNGTVSVIGKGLDDDETFVLSGQSRLSNGTRIAPSAAPAS